jgi:hypothetical protein
MKDNSAPDSESGTSNSFHLLLSQLSGLSSKTPRQITAVNAWRKGHRKDIEAEASRRAKELGDSRKTLVSLREKVAKEFFANLSQEEKTSWANRAKDEHHEAVEKWKRESTVSPSTDPADRQK